MINSNKIFATIVAVMLAIIAVYYVDISDGVVENFIVGSSIARKVASDESHPMAYNVVPKSHPVQVFKSAVVPRISRMSSMGLTAAVPDPSQVPEYCTNQNCREQVVEGYDGKNENDGENDGVSSSESSLMRAVMGSSSQMTLGTKTGRLHSYGDFIRGDLVPCKSQTTQGWFKSSETNTNNLQVGAVSMMTEVSPNSTSAMVQMAKARDGNTGHPTTVSSIYEDVSM